MKKKQSVSGLFFSMFLRAIVVILAIVIVCLGVALVRSLIHGKSAKTVDTGTGVSLKDYVAEPEENTGGSAVVPNTPATETPTTEKAADKNIRIAVLNGTTSNGVAAGWKERLNNAGYNNVEAGNYKGTVQSTQIWFKSEQAGHELEAGFKSPEILETFDKTLAGDVNIDEMDVVIVIGASDDIMAQQ